MVDLHSHILPKMDDGARNLEESLKLLTWEKSLGIEGVALTPHFNLEEESVQEFQNRRNRSLLLLKEGMSQSNLSFPKIKVGAEVRFSPALTTLGHDLEALLLEGTSTLLIELPFHFYPPHLSKVLKELDLRGVRCLLAHVERYSYFRRNPQLLKEIVSEGCLCQLNTHSLVTKTDENFAKILIKKGYIHVLASDCHNTQKRVPLWDEVDTALDQSQLHWLSKNSHSIWLDGPVDKCETKEIKRFLGRFL